MAAIHSDEFKRDAVRIVLTSGLTRRQVASGLGIGLSIPGSFGTVFALDRVTDAFYAFKLIIGTYSTVSLAVSVDEFSGSASIGTCC